MERVKARELGLSIGRLPIGAQNCITDVAGVKVGHVTLDHSLPSSEDHVCTGVTAILPHDGNLFRNKVVAASYVVNGFGKTTGLVQVDELGLIESPIMLTNTFGVPAVTQGTIQYMLEKNPEIGDSTGTINVVVGECNDSYLNSIRTFPVKADHALEALRKANDYEGNSAIEEGAVGAGRGMVCFGFKGGIGSSSRVVHDEASKQSYTVGGLVLSNFGKPEEMSLQGYTPDSREVADQLKEPADGSIMMVLATDAPLSDRQLRRVAKRCSIGLGRTGSHFSHGSGDIVIAFTTANQVPHFANEGTSNKSQSLIREDSKCMSLLFTAAAEVIEEAILNSLSKATTTKGRKKRTIRAIPLEWLQKSQNKF
jgi:D-aminopeptidase